jgi:hypothetical protein
MALKKGGVNGAMGTPERFVSEAIKPVVTKQTSFTPK